MAGPRWLRPAEQLRVALLLAADPLLSAGAATRHVRASKAAGRLYQLRQAQRAGDSASRHRPRAARWLRRAERRARGALARAGFADPAVAAEVLRQVQVLTLTSALAELDYTTPDAAHAALGNLIRPGAASPPSPRRAPSTIPNGSRGVAPPSGTAVNGVSHNHRDPAPRLAHLPTSAISEQAPGHPEASPASAGAGDGALADAAARIVAGARQQGARLSQAGLAGQLRAQGYSVANHRLRWLAAASGLSQDRERA